MAESRHMLGCMTGTSLDGLDVALVRIDGQGLAMRAAYQDGLSAAMPGDLAKTLGALGQGEPASALTITRTARQLGQWHADVAGELIQRHPQVRVEGVVAHGQTIWHGPDESLSWQLFDPWPMVRALGLPVCHDLRQADLVAGGQGAPITPLADWFLFRDHAEAVVNLGGICNITQLAPAPEAVSGGDIGPCNLLIDGLCQRTLDQPFDEDGRLTHGVPADEKIVVILEQSIEAAQRHHGWPRTLGREVFDDAWLDALAHGLQGYEGKSIVASAIDAVGRAIGRAVAGPRILLAGGGAKHPRLTWAIRETSGQTVGTTQQAGVPVAFREAAACAVLGALSLDGQPITLPAVTGASRPGRAGSWSYP